MVSRLCFACVNGRHGVKGVHYASTEASRERGAELPRLMKALTLRGAVDAGRTSSSAYFADDYA